MHFELRRRRRRDDLGATAAYRTELSMAMVEVVVVALLAAELRALDGEDSKSIMVFTHAKMD